MSTHVDRVIIMNLISTRTYLSLRRSWESLWVCLIQIHSSTSKTGAATTIELGLGRIL